LCGPLRVELDGRRVEGRLPARQGRLLFAYLVLRRRRTVGRDELVEALWPHAAPVDPHAALNTLVARLRAALGAGTIAGRGELSLALGLDPSVDVETAHAAVTLGQARLRAGRPADACACAEEALAIIDQPLLRDLDRPWLDDERRHLEALRPALLAMVGEAALALGGPALARGTEAARDLTVLDPFRESARALLIRLLAAAGDVAEAVRVYDDLRVHLRDELGTVPSPQLTALHERLLTAPEDVVRACAEQQCPPGGAPQVLRSGVATLPRALRPVAGQLPYAGREQQLAHLTRCWADVDAGVRRVAVISGEAGIGKTRTAAELAARVHADGSLVLYGRCDEGLAVPYQPFVEALRTLLPKLDLDRVRGQLDGLAPELGRLLPELGDRGSPAAADPESARFALFEAVARLLEATTQHRRTLLVIDDVHWAAPATLLLLRHLVRSDRPLALMIVIAFRSTELLPDEPLAQLLADLKRDNSAEHLVLRGLGEGGIDVLLKAALGAAVTGEAPRPGEALVRALGTQTGGNPFFLREVLAQMVESAQSSSSGDDPGASVTVTQPLAPEGLRQVIGQRVVLRATR
jgi:DNA-binding SARP family transcriptional activator